MNCIFFGHREVGLELEFKLRAAIFLAVKCGARHFYVGNNGGFDFLVERVLRDVVCENDELEYSIVLSRIDEQAIGGEQEATVFCEGMERALPRFAVSKRNDWLLKNADMLIAYVSHRFSNCEKLLSRARKRGIRILNLADKDLSFEPF